MKVNNLFLVFWVLSSFLFAGGRKPIEFYPACKLIELSYEEQKRVNTLYIQYKKLSCEEEGIREWYKIESHPILAKIFPEVNFYKVFGGDGVSLPPTCRFIAEFKGRFYSLPTQFNSLLLDNNLEVNDKNIIDIAKAFVVIASFDFALRDLLDSLLKAEKLEDKLMFDAKMEEEGYKRGFPQITFLEGKRIEEKTVDGIRWDAEIKCRIGGGEIQVWKFCQTLYRGNREWEKLGQFFEVRVVVNGKIIRGYDLSLVKDERRGKAEDNSPIIEIATEVGHTTVEEDSFHYPESFDINSTFL